MDQPGQSHPCNQQCRQRFPADGQCSKTILSGYTVAVADVRFFLTLLAVGQHRLQRLGKGSATVLRGNGKVGVFQEAVSEDDQFAHEDGEGEFFGFAVGEEAQVEGFENWVVA